MFSRSLFYTLLVVGTCAANVVDIVLIGIGEIGLFHFYGKVKSELDIRFADVVNDLTNHFFVVVNNVNTVDVVFDKQHGNKIISVFIKDRRGNTHGIIVYNDQRGIFCAFNAVVASDEEHRNLVAVAGKTDVCNSGKLFKRDIKTVFVIDGRRVRLVNDGFVIKHVERINFGVFRGGIEGIIDRTGNKKTNRKIKCQEYDQYSKDLGKSKRASSALLCRFFNDLLFADLLLGRCFISSFSYP